jgi:hypothetical protein
VGDAYRWLRETCVLIEERRVMKRRDGWMTGGWRMDEDGVGASP